MIAYKVTCLFRPEWRQVYKALFDGKEHCQSVETPDYSIYVFEDDSVVPKELGVTIIVTKITLDSIVIP